MLQACTSPSVALQVFWKQFAIDFDNIPLPDGPEKPSRMYRTWKRPLGGAQLAALSSWGWPSRLLTALHTRGAPLSCPGPSGMLHCSCTAAVRATHDRRFCGCHLPGRTRLPLSSRQCRR